VRSPLAYGRIVRIDTDEAGRMPGVEGVWTAADLSLKPPASDFAGPEFGRPPLATTHVRFAGEPVAVVLAASAAEAVDAAERVVVDYEPLRPVVDPLEALEPAAPVVHADAGTNVVRRVVPPEGQDVLAGADVVVRHRFVNQRVAHVPLEPSGIVATPDGGRLTVWVPCQAPFMMRRSLAQALGVEEASLDVVAPAVGGSFGSKVLAFPEQVVVAALALRLGRTVRYTETRSENMVAGVHGRGQVQDVELGALRDGTITGLRVRIIGEAGAYPWWGTTLPGLTTLMASGVYRIPRIDTGWTSVATNTAPTGPYRGAGRPEATAMIERAMDLLADELAMDPVELRRHNFIPPEAFPYKTPTGTVYDIGDYGRTLDELLEMAGYRQLRADQAKRRSEGDVRQLGIGVSCYVEITGWGSEYASLEVETDGRITLVTGTSPHGQGHETAFSQIVSGVLSVPVESVRVVHSDTRKVARGEGTMGSRSLQIGGSAVLRAAETLAHEARLLAARRLGARSGEVAILPEGRVGLDTERSFTWGELAAAGKGLRATEDFKPAKPSFPFGAHLAVVEVDTETGQLRLLRLVAVDDAGTILNPQIVEGQVHGGLAQGAGQALYEEMIYDEDGNPLTGNLMGYALAGSADLPSFETGHTETPTPLNPLGAKGIGESGAVGATPAVQNAVIDAVRHLGVRHIDMPLTPARIWEAMAAARSG
jgi:aerobic carbon-monoxide dehydrogenase large subunit